MAISFEQLLDAHHFTGHPFATTNAEQERTRLASYFVHVPWFDRLVGDPRQPESLILFAPRGHGKTSHRLEVGRIAGDRHDSPALVVTFTEFDRLLAYEQLDITHYLAIIRQATLEAFARYLRNHSERERYVKREPAIYARFGALLKLFAPLAAIGLDFPQPQTEALMSAFRETPLGVKDWLKELVGLIQAANMSSVYCLIDGIDEHSLTSHQPDRAIALLRPLLEAPGVLQECGFAFKFFLPDMLEAPMRQQQVGRLDRIPVCHLSWSDTELRAMLIKRLTSYSLIGPTSRISAIHSFQDLCEPEIDGDTSIVRAAHASPRRLIDLARQIMEEHCRRIDDAHTPISAETIADVLNSQAPLSESALHTSAQPDIHEPPALFYDERGDIWIGNQRRNLRPLPKQIRRCMDFLWAHRQRTVRYEELQQELYGDSLDIRGDPRASCDKIVRRLRVLLEPDAPQSQTYVAVQPGTGYVLCHFRT